MWSGKGFFKREGETTVPQWPTLLTGGPGSRFSACSPSAFHYRCSGEVPSSLASLEPRVATQPRLGPSLLKALGKFPFPFKGQTWEESSLAICPPPPCLEYECDGWSRAVILWPWSNNCEGQMSICRAKQFQQLPTSRFPVICIVPLSSVFSFICKLILTDVEDTI